MLSRILSLRWKMTIQLLMRFADGPFHGDVEAVLTF